MTSAYFKSLKGAARDRYLCKLNIGDGNFKWPDPYDEREIHSFKDNVREWPEIDMGHMREYLVNRHSIYTRQALHAKKSLEAYNYFVNGKVREILICSKGEFRMLLAKVVPGQKERATPHRPWIISTFDGEILAAHCTCMAGLGEACSHAAAVMFAVEATIREGMKNPSCTSQLAAWKKTVKEVEPAPASKIDFSKPKIENTAQTEVTSLAQKEPKGDIKRLYTVMKEANPDAAIFSIFPKIKMTTSETDTASESEDEVQNMLPSPLTALFEERFTKLDPTSLEIVKSSILDSMHMTTEQVDIIERATKAQSNSEIWHEQRRGRITSSIFSRVCRYSGGSVQTLLSEIMGYENSVTTTAMNWGKQKEAVARNEFIKEIQKGHVNFQCQKAGLYVLESKPWLAASPDGVIYCECCGNGILEIKCPYKYSKLGIDAAIRDIHFFLDEEKHLKKNHPYFYQIQGQLAITNRPYACLFVWTCVDSCIVKISFDEHFWKEMEKKLTSFFIHHVLDELLIRRMDRNQRTNEQHKTFCICNGPEYGKMITCQNSACEKVWFHFRCVNITRRPSGKWMCPQCKTSKQGEIN